jgi:hypothetical protein
MIILHNSGSYAHTISYAECHAECYEVPPTYVINDKKKKKVAFKFVTYASQGYYGL